MTYTVSIVRYANDRNDCVQTDVVGTYADKIEAMRAAKRAARTRKDCETYGPNSIAYVGRETTAVVAW